MSQVFDRDGVRFTYPSGWELEFEEEGGSWTASIQGPGTAFMVVSYVPDVDDPSQLVEAALEGLRADYPALEADDAVDTLAGQPAIGADVSFVHFDLTNTCWVRSVASSTGCVLVLAQCTDEEIEDQGERLKGIMGSMTVEE
jgi:hypothetical protein